MIKPLYDRVLIQRVAEPEKTAGGLYIPDSAKEKPVRGKVVAVGSGYLNKDGAREALDVQVGNEVLFGKFAGVELTVDGSEYLMMKEDDILGIVEN